MGAKVRVLVVDGEPLVARALRRELLRDGIDVELPSDEAAPSQLDGAPPPDAVISSFRISQAADRDFIPFIDDPASLAVCVISSAAGAASVSGTSAGCRVLIRPWDSQELAKAVRKSLLGHEGGRPARMPLPSLRAI